MKGVQHRPPDRRAVYGGAPLRAMHVRVYVLYIATGTSHLSDAILANTSTTRAGFSTTSHLLQSGQTCASTGKTIVRYESFKYLPEVSRPTFLQHQVYQHQCLSGKQKNKQNRAPSVTSRWFPNFPWGCSDCLCCDSMRINMEQLPKRFQTHGFVVIASKYH